MKALFIIAQDAFRDEEYLEPKKILEENGIEVVTASLTTETAIGMLGAEVTPDIAIKDVSVDDYDIIINVGGKGAPELAKNEDYMNLLKSAKKLIGAICIAPTNLAKAGILQGKKATVFKTEESVKQLQESGAEFIDKEVVVDGNLVTANGPKAATKFGDAIVQLLKPE